jgi:hypothetical protein
VQQAAGGGHEELVKFLVQHGADLRQKNDYGGDALGAALFWAQHGGHGNGLAVIEAIARAVDQEAVERRLAWAEAEGLGEIAAVLRKARG